MLHQAGNRFNAQELWQQDHDHVLHPYHAFRQLQEGRLARPRRGRWLLCDGRQRAALFRWHRRHVVRQCRLWPQGNRRDHGRAGAAAVLHQLLRRRHQCAGRPAGREARGTGARHAQSRGLCDIRLLRRRHRDPHGAFLPVAPRRAHAPLCHLAQEFLSRLDLSRHDGGPARRRPVGAFQIRPGPRPPSLRALSLSPARGHEPRGLQRLPGRRIRRQDRGAGGGEHRLLHRRARAGLRRRLHSAAQLPAAHARTVHEARHPVHRRRDRHRLRAARPFLRVRGRVRHRSRT